MLIAPSEPARLKALGTVSSLPERHGVDILYLVNHGDSYYLAGAQRKEYQDFLASMRDDRLALEVGQMQSLHTRLLILEGRPRWTIDGQPLDGYSTVTRAQLAAMLLSFQDAGIWVLRTDDLGETCEAVQAIDHWLSKASHDSLWRRHKAVGRWGTPDRREWVVWFLQGIPGVGVDRAAAIYDHLGLPMAWTVDEATLRSVPGVGAGVASALLKALGGSVVLGATHVPPPTPKAPRRARRTQ